MSGELTHFEKRRAGVEQQVDALARQKFSARLVTLGRRRATAEAHGFRFFAQILHQRRHGRAVGAKIFGARVDAAFDDRHQRVSAISSRPISMRRISEVPAPIS